MIIDIAVARRLAVKGGVDPRSILRQLAYYRGERDRPVKGMAGHRADAVLEEEGLLPPKRRRPTRGPRTSRGAR
jgi:hypothetical protein